MLEIILFGIIIAGLLVVIWVVVTYNYFMRLNQQVKNSWYQIEIQLQRRYDLIPNLVETVKGYMKHEKETLTKIAELRSAIVNGTPSQRALANNQLSSILKTIFAVAENYPALKANENFLKLQEELTTTENRIAYARQAYNDSVYFYNTTIVLIPNNILALLLGLKEQDFFSIDEKQREISQLRF